MEVVAPASLQTAINIASPGEMIAIAGVFRENITLNKPGLKIIVQAGKTAIVNGRVWVRLGVSDIVWDGPHMNGRNPAGLPSPTVNGPNSVWRNFTMTNEHTGIGFDFNAYGGGDPSGFLIENFRIHRVGKFDANGKGTNHDHGIYVGDAQSGLIRQGIITDCADRGLQLYSNCHNVLAEHLLIAYCGQLLLIGGGEWGIPSSGNTVRKSILAYTLGGNVGGLYAILANWENGVTPGVNNNVDVILWSPPIHPTYEQGLTVTKRVDDPQFMNAAGRDFRLRAGSPAVGYGPASIQPGGVPTDRAVILAQARAHMRKASILYSTFERRRDSNYYGTAAKLAATEWAKTDALLDQLI